MSRVTYLAAGFALLSLATPSRAFFPCLHPCWHHHHGSSSGVAPGFAAPSFVAPSFAAPTFVAPSFIAPSYVAPSFIAPSYVAPSFIAPSYVAPNFAQSTGFTPYSITAGGKSYEYRADPNQVRLYNFKGANYRL